MNLAELGGVVLVIIFLWMFVIVPYSVSVAVKSPRFKLKPDTTKESNWLEIVYAFLLPPQYLFTRMFIGN